MRYTPWDQHAAIPDLNDTPRERWSEVLKPLPHPWRRRAVSRLRTMEAVHAGWMVVGALELEDPPQRGPVPAPTIPMPDVATPPVRSQINFRLDEDQRRRLDEAAELFGLSRTQFARMLVMRGVDEALRARGSG